MKKILMIKNLSKSYKENKILENINLDVYCGDIISIVGSSGCGKTSLLKCINGLLKPDSGEIFYKGVNINDINSVELKMNIGIVFQDYNLFDNMSVIENLIVGLINIKKIKKDNAIIEARSLLEKFNLLDKENNYPDELSGGERQRVAIIRTLLMKPKVILLDEPTSSLDRQSKNEMLEMIKELSDAGMTIIIVSHEEDFVKKVSTRIIKIKCKKLVELY